MAQNINCLASYPKSGNTWVRMFMDAYVFGKADINNIRIVLSDERVFYYQMVCPIPFNVIDATGWSVIRPAALHAMLLNHSHRAKLILKSHNINSIINDIPLFPLALFSNSIYLIRNPVDMLPSMARHMDMTMSASLEYITSEGHGFEPNIDKMTMYGFMSRWDRHVKAWERFPYIKVIRYEDLKDDPEKWFAEILKHYGIEVDDKKLVNAIDLVTLDKLKAQEEESGFRESVRGEKFFGATKDKAEPEHVERLISEFGEVMEKYGYI